MHYHFDFNVFSTCYESGQDLSLSVLNDIFIGRILSVLFALALLLRSLGEAYVAFFKVASTALAKFFCVLNVLQNVFFLFFVFHVNCNIPYLYNDSLSIFYHNHFCSGRGYSFACISDRKLAAPMMTSDLFRDPYIHLIKDSNGIIIRERVEKALLFRDYNGIFMREKMDAAMLLKGDLFWQKK
jgi:hypothetical protein